MPELDISAEKVAWIILRARELEGKVAPFMNDREAVDEQGGAILENRPRDATEKELRGFFAALNEDELTNLVALCSYMPQSLSTAVLSLATLSGS